MLARALPVALGVAGCVVGCSSSCHSVLTFSASPNPSGVNISGYEAFDCTVTLSSKGRSATTLMKAPSAYTIALPPTAPTMTDELSCGGLGSADAAFCTQTSGPAYASCGRSSTCLDVRFWGDAGVNLNRYLGATGTYDVRVECGGVVVATRTNVSSWGQLCAV